MVIPIELYQFGSKSVKVPVNKINSPLKYAYTSAILRLTNKITIP